LPHGHEKGPDYAPGYKQKKQDGKNKKPAFYGDFLKNVVFIHNDKKLTHYSVFDKRKKSPFLPENKSANYGDTP
jgi:hypothetical protein